MGATPKSRAAPQSRNPDIDHGTVVRWTVRALPPPPPTRYTFDGFFAPLANAPVVNEVKAGKGVNVRFSLDLVFRFDDGQERVARFRLGR